MKLPRPVILSIKAQLLGVSLVSIFYCILLYISYDDFMTIHNSNRLAKQEQAQKTHFAVIENYLKGRENWTTSIVGSWLFKYNTYVVPQNKSFFVYFNTYRSPQKDPLQGCSVTNCYFTGDDHDLPLVDAVLVHIQYGILPSTKNRNPQQRWIFLNDESPYNVFSLARRRISLKKYANIFNWSMTYRTDADIPIMYGRTVPLDEPVLKIFDPSSLIYIIPNWHRKRRDVLITALISNCNTIRKKILKRIHGYIPVDVFGKCSENKSLRNHCPGHFTRDCDSISEYLFYLALENSDCREYMTEKIWYNAYMKGAIPIIMGPSINDCNRLLPPNSFLHISRHYNDTALKELVKNIINISEDDDLLLSFHHWRNDFVAINEHGYFGRKSTRLCRLCEGLNYNDVGQKIYDENDIRQFLDPKLLCGAHNI